MPLPNLYPLSIMQGLERGSSGRNPLSQSFYTCPRPPFLLHKRQTWHDYVSVLLCTHVTIVPMCAWLHSHLSACLIPRHGPAVLTAWYWGTIPSYFFQLSVPNEPSGNTSSRSNSPSQTWTSPLGPASPTCPYLSPHPHLGSLHCQPLSSFLKGPPESPPPPYSVPENSKGNCECDGHAPQVRGGISMKEGPEALLGGPPLNLFVGPALSAFRLRLPGRDPTPAPLEDMLSSHFVHWHLSHPICPVKAFLQQLSFPVVASWHGRWGLGIEMGRGKEGEMRCVECALEPVTWRLFRPTLQPLSSYWSL